MTFGNVERSVRGLGLALVVCLIGACRTAPSQAAAEPTPGWVLTLAQNGAARVTGAVFDDTGFVASVVVVPPDRATPLSEADYQKAQQTNVLVRPLPDSDRGFLVDWAFGVCDPDQRVVVSRAGSTWNVAVDLGTRASGPCDLVLLSTELRVTTTASVDAHGAVTTMTPRSTPAPSQ